MKAANYLPEECTEVGKRFCPHRAHVVLVRVSPRGLRPQAGITVLPSLVQTPEGPAQDPDTGGGSSSPLVS